MMKKVWIAIVILALLAVGYSYYQSQQKPEGVFVATDGTTGSVVTTGSTGEANMNIVVGSTISWKATKPEGFHTGTVMLMNGMVSLQNGIVTAGDFTIDMTSVQLLDTDNEKLEAEIRDDFFEAPTYPTAKFVITKVEQNQTDAMVYGNLTIKDTTNPISFPATITTTEDNSMSMIASFAIDRTLRNLTKREGIVNNYLEFDINLNFNS